MKRLPVALLLLFTLILSAACTSALDEEFAACEEAFPAYAEQMSDINDEWEDTLEIAASTSRISLSGPVSELQSIRRDAADIEPPTCVTDAHAELDETRISIARTKMMTLLLSLEQYKEDPESYFEARKANAATATEAAK